MPNEYTGKVERKLLPDKLAGKSYWKNNMKVEWIVIHNTGGANTVSSPYNHFAGGSGGLNTSTQYATDATTVLQMLEDNWKAVHCGPVKKGNYAADRGCSNANSIGIEMCDGPKCDKEKAMELTIELARYLCKKHNVPFDNVVRHNDVSGKTCPEWIMNNNKWDYFKKEVKRRNEENVPVSFDSSTLDSSGQPGGGGGSGDTGGGNVELPDFDNRENWTNLEEIKGVVLVHHPPQHFYSVKNKEDAWAKIGYKQEFHTLLDSTGPTLGKDKTLIANSIQNNDRFTYINRALYGNKAIKFTLSLGLFTSVKLEDYTVTEKKMIEELSKLLYDNALKTKDLWREFDLNRAPSPFMYLDREQWKKLLREVDKQVEWRYANFGEPEVPEKEPVIDEDDKNNVGKEGFTNRRCTLREQPNMTSSHVKVLDKDALLDIKDYNNGFYKVEMKSDAAKGWIVSDSVSVGKPDEKPETFTDNKIPQPEIVPTMTHEEYLKWKELTDPKYIDNFAAKCEPYDKGLKEITEAPVTDDDRLASLTKELKTYNENTIYYSVTEGSPGDSGHCVKPTAELNMLYKPEPFKVDPIYPDLIIPPNYVTSDNNKGEENQIPLVALEEGLIKKGEDFDNNDLFFDFDLLAEMNKKSKGKPVNYLDAYPYDDKIYELEKHSPKVKIDEIESRLYESNHPGDPMPQPVAKNFAMINDALLNQSKKVESRLVRLENTLAFVLRSLGRVGSRVNINCVYYGGQDVFGKYKTIRCLRDDRIHDACSVTLDQCISCTRYEPIIGQIYEILDDTGMNGSVMLDQMQMGYMELEQYKALNRVEERNVKQKFAYVHSNHVGEPTSIIDEWKQEDKDKYLESLKSKLTDEKEYEEAVKNVKEEDYAFKMNWHEQDLDLQEPDVKIYPTEGIKAKYKKVDYGDNGESEEIIEPDKSETNKPVEPESEEDIYDETDKEWLDDLSKWEQLNNGEWVDTREEADTREENKYSSEHYYFEDFNKSTGNLEGNGNSTPGGIIGSQAREKITEMALKIVDDHKNNLACYHQGTPEGNRTTDYNKKVLGGNSLTSPNAARYDCSSFVSCCYRHAALTSVCDKNTDAQVRELVKTKSKMWLCNEDGVKDAKPGDLVYVSKGKVTQAMIGKFIDVYHVLVYMGDKKVAHASNPDKPIPNQIRYDDNMNYYLTGAMAGHCFFARPADLEEADKKNAGGNPSGTTKGFIDAILPFALEAYKSHKILPSVTIGQGALESGWGKSKLATQAFNLYGVKADSRWPGEYVIMRTAEYGPNGKYYIDAKFRKYDSWAHSTLDHGVFLNQPRYVKAGVLTATDPFKQLKAICNAGYATDGKYYTQVSSIMKQYNLMQYDK